MFASPGVIFADSYLDFIELGAPGWRDHVASSALYGRGLAPSGLVLRCNRLPSAREAVAAVGLEPTLPYRIERRVSGAEPEKMVYDIFSTASTALPLAFIRDADPSAMRRPPWLDHPNAVTGVHRVWLATNDAVAARADADRLFPGAREGGTLRAGASSLVLLDESDHPLRSIRRILPPTGRSQLVAIEFETADLARLKQCLSSGGLRSTSRHDGGVELDPREGLGCAVSFVPAGSSPGS